MEKEKNDSNAVVLYPVLVPMIMAGTKATAAVLLGDSDQAWFWTRFLVFYDAAFLVASGDVDLRGPGDRVTMRTS